MFVSPARNFLNTFPIDPRKGPVSQSSDDSADDMPDAMEVVQAMMNLLPPPGEIFQPQYFRHPIYPVQLLNSVADFYGYRYIEKSILDEAEASAGDRLMSILLPLIFLSIINDTEPDRLVEILSNITARRKPYRYAGPAAPSVEPLRRSRGSSTAPS